jgi:hypothetical protein
MDNKFEQVSYGDGETNFFGTKTTAELRDKLASCSKPELRGLASKVGLNPNYKSTVLKDMILKEFRSYQANNSPIPAPKQMFSKASEDVIYMLKSVGDIASEKREVRMKEDQNKRTSFGKLED